jgi:hypothetical protein
MPRKPKYWDAIHHDPINLLLFTGTVFQVFCGAENVIYIFPHWLFAVMQMKHNQISNQPFPYKTRKILHQQALLALHPTVRLG